MKKKEDIVIEQKNYIADLKKKTDAYIGGIDKTEIQTVLLSGSVARGDYFPGTMDGMVDLTVMRKKGSTATAEEIFGKNEDPDIPFHCKRMDGTWYATNFIDFLDAESFRQLTEPRKFSILESEILYDLDRAYEKELVKIKALALDEQGRELEKGIGYIHYLISDYKKDRWYRREAFIQMHENLNAAVRTAVKCLYYLNGYYSPAEDRAMYYSHSLGKLPEGYDDLLEECCDQVTKSENDYWRREKIFMDAVVGFIKSSMK